MSSNSKNNGGRIQQVIASCRCQEKFYLRQDILNFGENRRFSIVLENVSQVLPFVSPPIFGNKTEKRVIWQAPTALSSFKLYYTPFDP